MDFIGVLNTKGGTGKTTLASCLAVRAARDARVAAVDLDPQASFTDWHGRRGAPDNPALMRGLDRASDAVEVLQRTGGYDFVIFDGPPGSILVTEDAVRASNAIEAMAHGLEDLHGRLRLIPPNSTPPVISSCQLAPSLRRGNGNA